MKQLKTYIANFFRNGTKESMMRLMSLFLIIGGYTMSLICLLMELPGAHYGLEFAVLGMLGKGYQKSIEKK